MSCDLLRAASSSWAEAQNTFSSNRNSLLALRQISVTSVAYSPYLMINAFCASVKFAGFIVVSLLSLPEKCSRKLNLQTAQFAGIGSIAAEFPGGRAIGAEGAIRTGFARATVVSSRANEAEGWAMPKPLAHKGPIVP